MGRQRPRDWLQKHQRNEMSTEKFLTMQAAIICALAFLVATVLLLSTRSGLDIDTLNLPRPRIGRGNGALTRMYCRVATPIALTATTLGRWAHFFAEDAST